jgi:hypothetical protein
MSTIARIIVVILVLVVVIIGASLFLNRTDGRTTGEKVGDVIDAVPVVVESAAAEFSESSPLAKAEDALEKAGNAAESAMSKAGREAREATSETSADIKAARDKQKQQDKTDKHNP